jgi:TolA-binding protein
LIDERAHASALDVLGALEQIGRPGSKNAARCLLELNRPREALAKLPENPTDPEESYLRGVALVAVGANAAGKEALQSVASATPASPWSLDAALRLARTAGNRVERQAAETLLEKLEPSADPTQRSAVRIELAMLAADLGRPLEAASELQALAESGDRGDALAAGLKLAEIFEQRGDYLQAERWLSRAEKAGVPPTGRPALAYRKASLAFRAKNWERVETLLAPFEETFANDPLAAAAQLLRAESALERGRAAEAVERFRKLDKLPGGEAFRATAHLRTSQALLLDKKWREAFAEAERYLATPAGKERPAEAWFVQGRTLQQQAQFAEARKSFERCAASGDAELQTRARFMIGESYFHQRRHRDALKEYLRAALLGGAPSWQAAALLQVGQCHEALGETVAARDTYAKAIERFPNEPATIEVRKRLAALPPDRAN